MVFDVRVFVEEDALRLPHPSAVRHLDVQRVAPQVSDPTSYRPLVTVRADGRASWPPCPGALAAA
jgi:hypothetical protein